MMDSANLTLGRGDQNSRLLSLPAEIRIQIYELAFSDYPKRGIRNLVDAPEATRQPALTQICVMVRQETLPILYSKHCFVFGIWSWNTLVEACRWVTSIGDHNVARMQDIWVDGLEFG